MGPLKIVYEFFMISSGGYIFETRNSATDFGSDLDPGPGTGFFLTIYIGHRSSTVQHYDTDYYSKQLK